MVQNFLKTYAPQSNITDPVYNYIVSRPQLNNDNGWQISVHEQVPYFTPPAHIDPHRRPRPGGRARLRDAA